MKNILVIYTGGTIGMVKDKVTGALHPFDMKKIYEALPVLRQLDCNIDTWQFDPIIDSSDMNAGVWIRLADLIGQQYDKYDGFVVLHGTDTMSYTASALSFLLEDLSKPVIITGSQLPLGMIRTDGRENIISAIEIAANEQVAIGEVCIFFENKLFRGNRTTKFNAEHFEAFYSGNYPSLAKVGINIIYKQHLLRPLSNKTLKVYNKMCDNVIIVKVHPALRQEYLEAFLAVEGLKGVVLETYGSGNAPTSPWFINAIKKAIDKGVIVLNVTQCKAGSVVMGHYEASMELLNIGVVSGGDITTEAALAKLMFVLANYNSKEERIRMLNSDMRGEITGKEVF
ncbi:MAG: asparaginase [Candidatus Onthomorpha sp.]|nr:asparaginase [Bacteroidales bacterium]MDY3976754.1 asparaginase [Candidatus Onthomorpha sp.]MCI5716631.1 asparaginase [Bacteroidales bacterium]MCI6417230.1 asparaginase [Bacteroidales bacterium]MCI6645107.1 asparaginase [Bacteroidales bacterium]